MSEIVVILLVVALCAAFGLLHRRAEDVSCSTATDCDKPGGCATCDLAPNDAESNHA